VRAARATLERVSEAGPQTKYVPSVMPLEPRRGLGRGQISRPRRQQVTASSTASSTRCLRSGFRIMVLFDRGADGRRRAPTGHVSRLIRYRAVRANVRSVTIFRHFS
jgi:hypothetical protein